MELKKNKKIEIPQIEVIDKNNLIYYGKNGDTKEIDLTSFHSNVVCVGDDRIIYRHKSGDVELINMLEDPKYREIKKENEGLTFGEMFSKRFWKNSKYN